jgi:hypothetical protein
MGDNQEAFELRKEIGTEGEDQNDPAVHVFSLIFYLSITNQKSNTSRQPRKLIFGIQPYFNSTR